MNRTAEHLRILSICHYVYSALVFLAGFFPLIHITVGVLMVTGVIDDGPDPEIARFVGTMFICIGSAISLLCWTMAILIFRAGSCLRRYRSHTFCFVIACIECMNMPLGTILGVFTIITLMRDEAKVLFGLELPGECPFATAYGGNMPGAQAYPEGQPFAQAAEAQSGVPGEESGPRQSMDNPRESEDQA